MVNFVSKGGRFLNFVEPFQTIFLNRLIEEFYDNVFTPQHHAIFENKFFRKGHLLMDKSKINN